jgi:hypothetical protein
VRFVAERHGIVILPESQVDVAYMEDTLGLRAGGDWVPLVRCNSVPDNLDPYLVCRQAGKMLSLETQPVVRAREEKIGDPGEAPEPPCPHCHKHHDPVLDPCGKKRKS